MEGQPHLVGKIVKVIMMHSTVVGLQMTSIDQNIEVLLPKGPRDGKLYERASHACGQKLYLQENKVKNKSWNFVLISRDMGSIVSSR